LFAHRGHNYLARFETDAKSFLVLALSTAK